MIISSQAKAVNPNKKLRRVNRRGTFKGFRQGHVCRRGHWRMRNRCVGGLRWLGQVEKFEGTWWTDGECRGPETCFNLFRDLTQDSNCHFWTESHSSGDQQVEIHHFTLRLTNQLIIYYHSKSSRAKIVILLLLLLWQRITRVFCWVNEWYWMSE